MPFPTPMTTHIRRIDAETALPLRWKMLRPHLPEAESRYPGDATVTSAHFGAYDGGQNLVGVATLLKENESEFKLTEGFRLRGMATLPEVQGKGFGGALLEATLAFATETRAPLVWCHAREGAKGFYLRYGFKIKKGPYALPKIGPHYLMVRDL